MQNKLKLEAIPSALQENTVQQKPSIQAKQQPVQRQQNSTIQAKQRPVQRQRKPTIQAKQRPVQRNNKTTEIATTLGEQHGVDTSGLEFKHNSSFPDKVGADATIQGNKIDFAPGKDTETNIKHEVGHYIINTQRGTPPVADKVVNGQAVNTTDEQAADNIANAPLQRKESNTASLASQSGNSNKSSVLQLAGKGKGGKGKAKKTAKKTGPKGGGIKKPWKLDDKRKIIFEYLKAEIAKTNPELKQFKKAHQARIMRSIKLSEEEPKTTGREEDMDFLRHLSTVVNSSGDQFQEVQAAINKKAKRIYISSNSKESDLPTTLGAIKTLAKTNKDDNTRVKRHKEKFIAEYTTYKGYKLEVVSGKAGQHAETKIVGEKGADGFDYIGGQRRPCISCEIYFQLNEVDTDKYNPHHGAYWEAQNSLKSIVEMAISELDMAEIKNESQLKKATAEWWEDHKDQFKVENKAYVNEGIPKKMELDYDTASEDEEF